MARAGLHRRSDRHLGVHRRSYGSILDLGEQHARRNVDVTGGNVDFEETPVYRRYHFDDRLVGLELGNHFSRLDRVPLRFQPDGDPRGVHEFRDPRQTHLNGHACGLDD
jgi:hypothetical protein